MDCDGFSHIPSPSSHSGNLVQEQPSTTLAAISGNVESMDFSMPSYGDSIKSTEIKTKTAAPSFNPFGDFEPAFKDDSEEKAAEAAKKAEEKAAFEQKKAEEKAALEQRKAEEKAAAEQKKAEEKAAAEQKKAEEKAAMEKKKSEEKAAAEQKRAAAAAEKVAVKVDASGSVAAPPAFDIPEVKAPEIKIPDFKAPDVKVPDFKAPAIDMPKFNMDTSKLGFDNIKMPDTSKLGFDNIKMPDTSKLGLDNINMPDASKLGLDKVSVPKVSIPSFGGDSGDNTFLESQDVRDAAAASARQVYLDADSEAKEKEEIARQYRAKANEKKADAKTAKDLACQTRPGGKLLCLRNPFKLGY